MFFCVQFIISKKTSMSDGVKFNAPVKNLQSPAE